MLERLTRKAKRLLEIGRFTRRTTPLRSLAYVPAFLRAVRLCKTERFAPAEAFRLGLFNARSNAKAPCLYVSRKKTTKIQEALNPPSLAPLARDKGIFYRYCMAVDVPIPKLYAILFGRAAGWSWDASPLAGLEDWRSFLAERLPEQFVAKPTRGAFGKGVNIFQRSGEGFRDAVGRSYSPDELYDALRSGAGADGMILQERLSSHPDLVRLSGTEFLQTVRAITLLDDAGSCRILHAHLKVIVGEEVVDTHLDGLLGNVEATVNVDDGRLTEANQITDTGQGVRTVGAHPKTGVAFEGFQLPHWPEACSLARETALKFRPLRAIGWDLALTATGVCVTEANVWWEPPNQHATIGALMRALARQAGPQPPPAAAETWS